ncbi:hypothetical protein V1264_024711 [Littorina saxatilis]|uniref:Uncharacterized protein n=1 Tax=Littorina saxatilis TaxID=31220 RepID=A0AAN9AMK2_9CAEN
MAPSLQRGMHCVVKRSEQLAPTPRFTQSTLSSRSLTQLCASLTSFTTTLCQSSHFLHHNSVPVVSLPSPQLCASRLTSFTTTLCQSSHFLHHNRHKENSLVFG